MEERPKYIPDTSSTDNIGNALGWFLFLVGWILAGTFFFYLPEIIPTHFGINGQVDDYGNRLTIFLLPAIGSLVFLLLKFLVNRPETFNFPVKITQENAQYQYRLAISFIRWLNVSILLLFNGITILIYYSAVNNSAKGSIFWIVSTLIVLFFPIIVYVTSSFKKR